MIDPILKNYGVPEAVKPTNSPLVIVCEIIAFILWAVMFVVFLVVIGTIFYFIIGFLLA